MAGLAEVDEGAPRASMGRSDSGGEAMFWSGDRARPWRAALRELRESRAREREMERNRGETAQRRVKPGLRRGFGVRVRTRWGRARSALATRSSAAHGGQSGKMEAGREVDRWIPGEFNYFVDFPH